MKIVYLTGEYPRATDTFIQREVAGLRAAGLTVETASIRRTGAEHHVGEEQRAEAARTFHVLEAAKNPFRLLKAHGALMVANPKRWFSALALAWRTAPKGVKGRAYQLFYFAEAGVLARQMQTTGAAHLHNHIAKASCTVAMLASELSGIPYSFTLHGPDIFFEPHHWRLDEKIARARFVSCISHFCRSQAMAFSAPEHWEKLHIVHCGVEPSRYAGAAMGEELLFVGRLAPVKGLPVLLHAMARVPDARLTIVGDGPQRSDVEALVRTLQLEARVQMLGYQNQDEVAALLSQSAALVLPSFAEGLPVVLMEAMAAGLPVITTRIAGVPELVKDGENGWLVAAGDEDGLRGAIEALLGDPARAAKMGAAGREAVCAEFDAGIEARRLAGLFHAYPSGKTAQLRPEPLEDTL
ncbi:glycosyltransferase family 4 protein [Lentibacter sp. XHP0401]|uniref:glycosyltransferase family 4 protein n=1 Tax=Lentibacter sp. XHP0401 TaxID=2984334 RepID=UPI0021E825C0|nr:glycosyltransferase family 4 protein [Lentibacter sp. XHP0401]MCV2893379.1 glycosyltransferase family 4 protein [Lentibacter sp. XHP0401]